MVIISMITENERTRGWFMEAYMGRLSTTECTYLPTSWKHILFLERGSQYSNVDEKQKCKM